MHCTEFHDYAPQWLEGEHAAEARAHLQTCTACRGLVTDLEAITATAAGWRAEQAEPPARVWNALRAQLQSEGLIRETVPVTAAGATGLFGFLSRPALAGAYLALLLVAGSLIAWQSTPPARLAMRAPMFEPAGVGGVPLQLNRVERRVTRVVDRRNPAVAASYREGLAIVDNFIALCEKAVREQPDNELARDYLYGAYQQKAELLATLLDRGVLAE